MLKIYTSTEKAKELSSISDIVPDIEARFDLRVVDTNKIFLDNTSIMILQKIEGMTERKGDYFIGKFGIVHLRDISTGGKTLLLAVNYRNESVVNIDECGYNCIHLLFEIAKTMDIEVISTRILYHMKPDFTAIVNGKEVSYTDITEEMEKELW